MSFNIFDMAEYLEDASDELRDPIELLISDFIDQARGKNAMSIEEFITQHPEDEDELRELLPMIAAVENLKEPANNALPTSFKISVPNQLDDYRIIREIGRGGMGIVYEAEQLSLGRQVALKLLPPTFHENARRLKRFQREAETAAKLHHNHIVQVFGVGQQDEYSYFVMQLIEGDSLERLIIQLARQSAQNSNEDPTDVVDSASTPLDGMAETLEFKPENATLEKTELDPTNNTDISINDFHWNRTQKANANDWQPTFDAAYWRRLAILGHQVADALCYAHAHNVLHRDIKPANLLIDGQGDVWVTDFGLAKLEDAETISQSNDVVGTLRYMAPEQFQGTGDARSDVYSLGMTLYEFVTLKPGYDEAEKHRLIHQILDNDPPATRTINTSVPRDLDTIVMKAIARNPADRYQSANALASDLRRFLENRPIAARPLSLFERFGRWAHKNPAIASLSSVVLLMLIAVSITSSFAFFRTRDALKAEQFRSQRLEASSKVGENLQLLFGNRSATNEDSNSTAFGTSPDDPQKLITSVVDGLESQFEHQSQLTKRYQELLALLNDFQSAEKGTDLRKSQLKIQRSLSEIQALIQEQNELSSPKEVLKKLEKLRSVQMDDSKLFELAGVYYRLATDEFAEVEAMFDEDVSDPVQMALRETKIETGKTYLENAMSNLARLEKKKQNNPKYQYLSVLCLLKLDHSSRIDQQSTADDRRLEQAISKLERLLTTKYASNQHRQTLCEAYLSRSAAVLIEATSGQSPSDTSPIGRIKLFALRYRHAVKLTERLLASSPNDRSILELRFEAYMQLGQMQVFLKDSNAARQSFNAAIRTRDLIAKQHSEKSELIRFAEQCVQVSRLLKGEPAAVRNGFLFRAARAVELLRQKNVDPNLVNRLSIAIQSEWSRPQVASPR